MKFKLWTVLALFIAVPFAAPVPSPALAQDASSEGENWLAPDVVLARVDSRESTVQEFINRYFNSLAEFRPGTDLEGRKEFLQSMITKDVLGLTAIKANRPLEFEDRLLLRQHRDRTLSNILFQRVVMDSIQISDADLQRVYSHYRKNIRLQHILFPSREAAAAARPEIASGKISWQDAVAKYSLAEGESPEGDLGWQSRIGFDAILAEALWSLSIGEISEPVSDGSGIHLMRVVEERPYDAPALESLQSHIKNDIRRVRGTKLSDRLLRKIAKEVGMTYDTTLVSRVATTFAQPSARMTGGGLTVDPNIPHFDPADTSQIIARWKDGALSLGRFVETYEEISPIARPPINTFDSVIGQIHAITLEPYRVELALKMKLDQDPEYVKYMATREEQIRVEHMFEDSITSQIWISKEERQQFYEENIHLYATYPKAKYARFHVMRKSLADSLLQRLAAGESAETLAAWDMFGDHNTAIVEERSQNEPAGDSQLLFEELLPGETRVVGPDNHDHYTVYQLIDIIPSRQLPLAEVADLVDESLRNIKAEAMLQDFIARHSKDYEIESHPELLPRIRLVDPFFTD